MNLDKRSQIDADGDSGRHDTSDRDPEAHAVLLLARIYRDVRVLYEPLDVCTLESARHTLEVLTTLRSALGSHRRAAEALNSQLEHKLAARKVRRD